MVFDTESEFKNEVPVSHTEKTLYLAKLDFTIRKHIFLVYQDLTLTDLLEKCLNQRTQNADENLHSKLWLKCLKVKHCSLAIVKFAAVDTVLIHNFGQCKAHLLANLNVLTENAVEDLSTLDSLAGSSRSVGGREGLSDDYQAGSY